ncbi:Nickel and cobalt resistance protein CnrA [Acaryochloris thomasi RCC1774]|uniref:Nickel and cobalt resistance protein CnrA n=1 Tax=Acaryochloris thomasi RCC1774 TaxID=1764569 RepID=A0A2W1JN56_9CYAN|nr:efflux RND transporter permease subunit [Acaryochloris thomasi]PZD70337.1 Nickel and cobalt resistance protein CnrA [Acaryochloris thomasi RCC1774]
MLNLFYRNRQLLFLSIALIIVWGLSAFLTLPRLEDPEITQRNSTVTTVFPGASPERVEALITDKIEEELSEIEEIDSLESTSNPGLSVVAIELKENIRNVDPVWARVRSQLEDVTPQLPAEALEPEYEDSGVKASALIVGLKWELDSPANSAILRRVAEGLEAQLRNVSGTDKVEIFGEPDEEILVEADSAELAQLGLTAQVLAQQINASDAKVSAGELRNQDELLLEVSSNLDSLERVRRIPIRVEATGKVAQLGDIAKVTKGVQQPVSDLTLIDGQPAIVVSATVESDFRVDTWAEQAHQVLNTFETNLSDGIGMTVVLDQSLYVQQRLNGVVGNLVMSSLLVVGVSLVILGWRSALIVGAALPLATLTVFGAMKSLGIPLHQMSVTGLIISLGLLIDNAIVVVDEVQLHLQAGGTPAQAIQQAVKQLAVPLLASTMTTVLAFVPIATSPGGTGEFIGTIGSTVILALISSLVLSLTVIAALTGLMHQRFPQPARKRWWVHGFANSRLTTVYRWSLATVFRRPILGIILAMVLPITGFIQFASLPQQFFPPTNRDQFQVEIELPATSAISTTQTLALKAREVMQEHPKVADVQWFLGKSAPSFFYNIISNRRNAANYAQGIVQLNDTDDLRGTVQTLQTKLDRDFPEAQILVKQLEQGPPFDAPIELRLYGPDIDQLRELGNQMRGMLAQVPNVIHTQADLTEIAPKLALTVDEVIAQRAGLDNGEIATQLNSSLDGVTGGSILEGTEELPVRVRLADRQRGNLSQIESLDLLSSNGSRVPFGALASTSLVPDISTIVRRDGQRINTVQAFLTAGALPDTVLTQFQQQLKDLNFGLPPSYRIEYGGEADARGSAVGNLLSTVGVLMVLMTAILVLSFNSFALAGVLAVVAIAAIGLAALALWTFDALFGFTAILGTLGLIGLALNDSIVVLAALQADPLARQGDRKATQEVVLKATRHIIATTVTTIIGFVPLMLDPTGFWPPLAIAIAGGLGGATLLALYFIPSTYLWLKRSAHRTSGGI